MDRFLGRWVGWVTAGEVAGFIAPAVVGAVTFSDGAADAVAPVAGVAAMVAAGAVEGTALGLAQAHVLGRTLPRLPRAAWVGATAAGAAVAWIVGMLPSTLYDTWSRWPAGLAILAGVLAATVLLCSIGTAQWFVLRHHVEHAGRWVGAVALAWGVGLLAFTAVTSPLWQPGQSVPVTIGVGVLGAVAMASAMAATTGLVLRRLLEGSTDLPATGEPGPCASSCSAGPDSSVGPSLRKDSPEATTSPR